MTGEQAIRCIFELTAAFPSVRLPAETVAVWRSWLEALPYAEAKRGVALVCAQHDFPTVHQMVAACGISAEPVLQMLVGAKEGGYELLRDPETPLGWRSSREALPAPAPVGVPCPSEIREQIKGYIGKLAEKRVPSVGAKS